MKMVVLTGAGISAESGIKTFRGSDGLWEGHRIEDVASPQGFMRDPDTVYRFYNLRRHQLVHTGVEPNAAHHALFQLEKSLGDDFLLVTQNIDDLHQRAGYKNIYPMHGELRKARCTHCHAIPDWDDDFDDMTYCPHCHQSGGLRPHVVWFGEMPLYMDDIYDALMRCDIFISIGTSGHVYPAAGFVDAARQHGAKTIEMNLEPSNVHSAFDEKIYGLATKTVSEWVDQFLKDQ